MVFQLLFNLPFFFNVIYFDIKSTCKKENSSYAEVLSFAHLSSTINKSAYIEKYIILKNHIIASENRFFIALSDYQKLAIYDLNEYSEKCKFDVANFQTPLGTSCHHQFFEFEMEANSVIFLHQFDDILSLSDLFNKLLVSLEWI